MKEMAVLLTMNIQILKPKQIKETTLALVRKPSTFRALSLALGGLLAVAGCNRATVVNTQAGGHQIRTIVAGNLSIQSQPESATITTAFGTVTIERTRVRISGAPWNSIPEAVPVELRISKGRIALTAGRVTIKQTIN